MANKPKSKKKRRRQPPRRNSTCDDFTIAEWCLKRRISRGTFYSLDRRGLAPKTMKHGKARRISHSADIEWQAAREAA
jgi:hypothetical protein